MNENAIKLLEFDKIRDKISEYAISPHAKEKIMQLSPSMDINVIMGWMNETSEARFIVNKNSSIPLCTMEKMDKIIGDLEKDSALCPEDLTLLNDFVKSGIKLKKFMRQMETTSPTVAGYAMSIFELQDLSEEIHRCIEYDRVSDKASPELGRIRKKVVIIEERIKHKLMSILSSSAYSGIIQDAVVSTRNGRYVIPIKKEYRKNVEGSVLDSSSSGSTLFIEPASVRKLQEELNLLKCEEENEVYKILQFLTGIAQSYVRELSINMEALIHYDFIFAKAKYSKSLECNPVIVNNDGVIRIFNGRHPLIGKAAVPLNFHIGHNYKALVITGPNTGGKTVTLKTVGLLTLMVQSGLHVPAEPSSEFSIFHDILADIGDGQSIEQSLSTFSSHITNISGILENATPNTLVIMDELGAGTDPAEGSGLAVAILEEIFRKGATIVATTHYSDIKHFASSTKGFKNGSMDFDTNTLKPLYTLKIGEAGASNALLIALRLGISQRIIERAHEVTYKNKLDYSSLAKEVQKFQSPDALPPSSVSPASSSMVPVLRDKKTGMQPEKKQTSFNIGDCVYISSMDRTGIVYELENNKGEVGVMVMKKKLKINIKRLKLYIEAEKLYPDNYDFDVIFETKEDRKKRKIMNKRHVDNLIIEKEK